MTIALRRLLAVEPRAGYRLYVAWDSGEEMTVDLTPMIVDGGVFGHLKSEEASRRVRIGDRRRTIEWPEPLDGEGEPLLDIDAEALLFMAREQQAPNQSRRAANA